MDLNIIFSHFLFLCYLFSTPNSIIIFGEENTCIARYPHETALASAQQNTTQKVSGAILSMEDIYIDISQPGCLPFSILCCNRTSLQPHPITACGQRYAKLLVLIAEVKT